MHLSQFTRAGIIALATVLMTLPASAQDEIDTSRVYPLEEVIVSATRWEQSAQTAGRNVTVISREEIASSLHTSVGDLLSEQLSVHLVGNGQTDGSVESLFLRNADGNHSVIMIDGVRLSDPSTPGNSVNLSELSLAGIQRIEIVRGSHSTLYGSSAIGGVVNIITRDRTETGFNAVLDSGHGTFGSGTYSMENTLSANYAFENGLYLDLGAVQKRTQGLDATVDTVTNPNIFNPQDRDDFSKLDLNGKVGYKGPDFDWHFSYRRVNQESDLDQAAYADDSNARIDFRRDLFSYGGSIHVSDLLELQFSGAYSELGRNFVNDSSLVNASGNYDGIYTETNGEGTLLENELTGRIGGEGFSAILGLGSTRQTMSAYSYTYSSAFDFESETDLDSLDLSETINKVFIYTELNGSLVSRRLDPFTLGLGARLSEHDRFGIQWTYEINPKVRVGTSTLLYGALTTGFNAPSLYQLYSPEQGFGAYTNRGNSGLDPETSVSVEAGWKQDIGSRVRFELSLFRRKVSDAIEYVYLWSGATPIEALGPGDYRGDTYLNLAEQVTTGIELGIRASLAPGLRISGNLMYARSTLSFSPEDVDNSYTGSNHVQIYEGGRFVTGDTEIDGLVRRPEFSAGARLFYRPTARLEFEVSTRYIGKSDDIFYRASLGPFGAADRTPVGGYLLTDLSAGYRFTSNLDLRVKVDNLFNTEYAEIKGYKTRPRGIHMRVRFSF